MKRIIITGHCGVASMHAVLACILPETEILSYHLGLTDPPAEVMAKLMSDADAWIAIPLEKNQELANTVGPNVPEMLLWPSLVFSAFHPDLTYVWRRDTGAPQRLLTDYHSAIGYWAWSHGFSVDQAIRLFVPRAFEALGYFDAWEAAESGLAKEFARADLDYGEFRLGIRRTGVFMHTINHPRIVAQALVAKQLVRKMGIEPLHYDDSILRYITDPLNKTVWPVYPSIADHLGVPGSFRWLEAGRHFASLRSWLEASWASYGSMESELLKCDRCTDPAYAILEKFID